MFRITYGILHYSSFLYPPTFPGSYVNLAFLRNRRINHNRSNKMNIFDQRKTISRPDANRVLYSRYIWNKWKYKVTILHILVFFQLVAQIRKLAMSAPESVKSPCNVTSRYSFLILFYYMRQNIQLDQVKALNIPIFLPNLGRVRRMVPRPQKNPRKEST